MSLTIRAKGGAHRRSITWVGNSADSVYRQADEAHTRRLDRWTRRLLRTRPRRGKNDEGGAPSDTITSLCLAERGDVDVEIGRRQLRKTWRSSELEELDLACSPAAILRARVRARTHPPRPTCFRAAGTKPAREPEALPQRSGRRWRGKTRSWREIELQRRGTRERGTLRTDAAKKIGSAARQRAATKNQAAVVLQRVAANIQSL